MNLIDVKKSWRWTCSILTLASLFVLNWTLSSHAPPPFTPSFKKAKKSTHKIPKGQKYTFGYLSVLENRSNPNSQIIQLPVYIFKSRNPNPQPDPIIYTVGGPGASTMRSAQYMKYYQYLDDRDFILIEQRGNYYARPHLDCPEWADAVYQSNLPGFEESNSEALFAKAAKTCKERLIKKGIDLNSYHTREIAADIADLRKALGFDQYNLLTISYSTKIAQVLLRDYPEGIRSVVMDSPLPLEVSYDEESVGHLMATLDQVLSDCEADAKCNAAFPQLKKRLSDYLIEKTQTPLMVDVVNPETGRNETFALKGKDLIFLFSDASTNQVPNIPMGIAQLLKGDLSLLKEQLVQFFEKPSGGMSMGMRLSVWCAEEYPFNDQEIIKKETWRYPEVQGLAPQTVDAAICEIWGVAPMPAFENQAIQSEVPVLLMSGEYDYLTPAIWAKNMQSNLSNSHHLIFPGWKHTVTTNWGNPCAMEAANQFFNHPEQRPMPTCLEEMGGVEFRTE
ncbi:MAG: alpha/beta fold hydrolase [Bacteroidota bacterium]